MDRHDQQAVSLTSNQQVLATGLDSFAAVAVESFVRKAFAKAWFPLGLLWRLGEGNAGLLAVQHDH
jgi:hypothetical protein